MTQKEPFFFCASSGFLFCLGSLLFGLHGELELACLFLCIGMMFVTLANSVGRKK